MKEKKGSGKGKAGIIAALAVLAIIVLCFGTIVNFVTDYWWFKDLGYTQVFFTKLFTEIKIAIPAFVITFILSQLYLTTLRREYMKKLDHFIISRTEGVKGLNNQYQLRACYDRAAGFYKKGRKTAEKETTK